jgi:hypothetical protein
MAEVSPRVDPPSMLGMGEIGTGKTRLIATLAEAGLEVFVIITEPTGLETLLDIWAEKKLDINKLHYKIITPARIGFEGLRNVAQKVSVGTFETLAKLPPSGDRAHAQWLTVIETLFNFVDDRTGQSFGPVDKFDDTRAVCIDSLSGLNLMAMDITIGDKSSAHQGEWGVAMGLLDKLLLNLTGNLRCPLYITAHLEPEADELTGARKLMAATLGKKLAPRVPRFFSEVFALKRTSDGWFLDTKDPTIMLKTRSLPVSDKLTPSLVPIIEAYRKRKAFASTTEKT